MPLCTTPELLGYAFFSPLQGPPWRQLTPSLGPKDLEVRREDLGESCWVLIRCVLSACLAALLPQSKGSPAVHWCIGPAEDLSFPAATDGAEWWVKHEGGNPCRWEVRCGRIPAETCSLSTVSDCSGTLSLQTAPLEIAVSPEATIMKLGQPGNILFACFPLFWPHFLGFCLWGGSSPQLEC